LQILVLDLPSGIDKKTAFAEECGLFEFFRIAD